MKIPKLTLTFVLLALFFALPMFSSAAHAADTFMKPTKEELAMTSLPGYPGAAAVVLTLDEEDNDEYHYKKYYTRIKVLTEKGKDLADVQIGYANQTDWDVFDGNENKQVTDIEARTIHPDGTVVAFTGKPYMKTIVKNADFTYQAKVFTLPDVQVGDIIEYRYAVRIEDNYFEAPDWLIQGKYFVKSAHFSWMPTSEDLTGADGGIIDSITWFPILPKGAKVTNRKLPGGGDAAVGKSGVPSQVFELTVKDIPPAPDESFMPPTANFTYRVLFNFSEYHSSQEYWTAQGKHWSKAINSFADPNAAVRTAAQSITAGASTQQDKLKKLYDAVEQMENTKYTRQHGRQEDKATGLGKVSNVSDVLKRKRGSPDDLTLLLVGLARAENMKAYAMFVPDRTHHIFIQGWMNMSQFDALIAIVNIDGKDVYLDPGERYTPYGHLAWQHTFVQGMRQIDGGTAIATTSGDGYKFNHTTRVANVKMDDKGDVSGNVVVTYTGSPAMQWRQRALQGDDESIRHSLRTTMERSLPKSLDIKVTSIDNLADYEQPLKVTYTVTGAVGSFTGKRLLVPADLFLSNEQATFPQEKRDQMVYFHYAQYIQDALGITLPQNLTVEAVPDTSKVNMKSLAAYAMSVQSTPTTVITHRDFIFGDVAIPVDEYAALRTFYTQFQANDRQQVVLKASDTVVPATTAPVAGTAAN